MAHIALALIAFERALRCVMPSEHRITRQQRPAVMLRQPRCKLIGLIEAAVKPPRCSGHGQRRADFGIGQPRRQVGAHDFLAARACSKSAKCLKACSMLLAAAHNSAEALQPLQTAAAFAVLAHHHRGGLCRHIAGTYAPHPGAHLLQIGGTSSAGHSTGSRIVA